MTVSRATNTDVTPFLAWTVNSDPSTTNIDNLCTGLYKETYRILGETYTTYSSSAEHPTIDSEECKMIIIKAACRLASQWKTSGATILAIFPSFTLDEIQDIRLLDIQKRKNRITFHPLWYDVINDPYNQNRII